LTTLLFQESDRRDLRRSENDSRNTLGIVLFRLTRDDRGRNQAFLAPFVGQHGLSSDVPDGKNICDRSTHLAIDGDRLALHARDGA